MSPKNDIAIRIIEAFDIILRDNIVKDKRELANRLGVSASMITEIVKGRSGVGPLILQNIVFQFGINANWLLTGEGPIFDKQESSDTDQEYPHLLDIIRSQAEEIGRLKEQIRQLTVEKEKHVSHASTSGIASAG